MRTNDPYCLLDILALHRFKKLKVVLTDGGPACRIVQAVDSPFQDDALENVAQGIFQRLIGRQLRDFHMNILVVYQPLTAEAFVHVFA
jgi:hypothetical protein